MALFRKCLQIREESRQKILRSEVLTKKLRQITWDRMSVHLRAVNGLKNNLMMFNYQVRKIGREEQRMLTIVFELRRAQRKERKRRDPELNYEFYCNRNVVNGGVIQPLILGSMVNAEKREERKEEKGKKKKEDELAGAQVEQVEEVFHE